MDKNPLKKQIKICNFKIEISNHYFFFKNGKWEATLKLKLGNIRLLCLTKRLEK